MKLYLLSIYQPDGAPPASVDMAKVMHDVDVLIGDMKASGAWVYNAGLYPPDTATVVRLTDREMAMTAGPYLQGKEHFGGLIIVQAADLEAGLEWGRQTAQVIGLPIEVRQIVEEAER